VAILRVVGVFCAKPETQAIQQRKRL